MITKTSRISMAVFMLLMMFQLFSACTFAGPFGIKGSGVVAEETRNVNDFTALDVSGGFEVILSQGSTQKVVIEADDNLMKEIITEVRGGELNIYTRDNVRPKSKMVARITFVKLEDIEISGAVNIKGNGQLTFDRLGLDGSGASEIELEANVRNLSADLSGASTLRLKGNGGTVSIECSGASKLHLSDFIVSEMSLDLSGASNAHVYVTDKLSVEASGASDIRYKGDPKIYTNTSGAASVKRVD